MIPMFTVRDYTSYVNHVIFGAEVVPIDWTVLKLI